MKKPFLLAMVAILGLAVAFAGGNATAPRLEGERAALAERIAQLQSRISRAVQDIQSANNATYSARREAAAAESRIASAQSRIAEAQSEAAQAERERQAALEQVQTERGKLNLIVAQHQRAIAAAQQQIALLDAKLPKPPGPMETTARLAEFFSEKANGKCPTRGCKRWLELGELRLDESGRGSSGERGDTQVVCPACQKPISYKWAYKIFSKRDYDSDMAKERTAREEAVKFLKEERP